MVIAACGACGVALAGGDGVAPDHACDERASLEVVPASGGLAGGGGRPKHLLWHLCASPPDAAQRREHARGPIAVEIRAQKNEGAGRPAPSRDARTDVRLDYSRNAPLGELQYVPAVPPPE